MNVNGRPTKGTTKRDVALNIRISKEDSDKIQKLSDKYQVNKTDTVIAAVDMMYEETFKTSQENNEDCKAW